MSNIVTNMKDFMSVRGFGEETFEEIQRSTYKYTDCGAWVSEDKQGVELGSIVEGVDEGTQTHSLDYPFDIKQFWKALQAVEDEAEEIWKATHGCEDCHDHTQDTEVFVFDDWPINPDCKTCKGEGAII